MVSIGAGEPNSTSFSWPSRAGSTRREAASARSSSKRWNGFQRSTRNRTGSAKRASATSARTGRGRRCAAGVASGPEGASRRARQYGKELRERDADHQEEGRRGEEDVVRKLRRNEREEQVRKPEPE